MHTRGTLHGELRHIDHAITTRNQLSQVGNAVAVSFGAGYAFAYDGGSIAQPQHYAHLNAKSLSATNCDGCLLAAGLIKSDLCNSTETHDSALKFSLNDVLSFNTDGNGDIMGEVDGWLTKPFSVSKSNSTPVPFEDFMAARYLADGIIDALYPEAKEYNLAIYLYNNETKPIACATLDLVTDEDDVKFYDNLVVSAGGSTSAFGDESSGGFSMMMTSTVFVMGMSVIVGAILLASA